MGSAAGSGSADGATGGSSDEPDLNAGSVFPQLEQGADILGAEPSVDRLLQ